MVYIYALIEMVQAHPNWKELLFRGTEAETGQIQPRGYSAQGFFAGEFLGSESCDDERWFCKRPGKLEI